MSDAEKSGNDSDTKKPLKKSKRSDKVFTKGKTEKPKSDNLKWYILSAFVVILAIGYPILLTSIFTAKIYHTCSDYFRENYRFDGIYEISPDTKQRLNVFCNMSAGGWTVIYRQDDTPPIYDFQVPHYKYKIGFGDLRADFFLGLETIHLLTRSRKSQLLVTLNETSYRYNRFAVSGEFYHYKLVIDEEVDQMPDGTTMLRLNNSRFSAIDVDFDLALNSNCSSAWKGGWWFTDCFDHSLCLTCMISHGNKGIKKLTYSSLMIK